MKKILAFLIFNLLIINPISADDIRDLQIEGISIGDSGLKHVSENTITTSRHTTYKDDSFYSVDIMEKFGEYDAIQFHLKKGDKKYIIYGISGAFLFGEASKYYPKSEKECKNKSLGIEKDLNSFFSNAKKQSSREIGVGHADPGVIRQDTYYFLDTGQVWLQCYTFSKKFKKKENAYDNLRLTILSEEFRLWMNTKAY
ncbi:MAG: hypothetical protein ISQ17_02265 [Pelagibacteraceae bacterium]|jgi:hypothetical protein|nr:hypothetical protein [Pelagibacteraceae bacterium]MDC0164595.1 hypothetical protein [Candidatus Pelagibacter bacterium]